MGTNFAERYSKMLLQMKKNPCLSRLKTLNFIHYSSYHIISGHIVLFTDFVNKYKESLKLHYVIIQFRSKKGYKDIKFISKKCSNVGMFQPQQNVFIRNHVIPETVKNLIISFLWRQLTPKNTYGLDKKDNGVFAFSMALVTQDRTYVNSI